MKTALLFSGQGSQYVGMAKDVVEEFPKAKERFDQADSILGFKLSEIMFAGPLETLKETRYTQPAIFLHSATLTDLLDGKLEFSGVAGHSVGEYAALYAAGVLKFEDALKLVALRGKLMFEAGETEPGTMFAVIGGADEKIEDVCKILTEKADGDVVVPANYNSPGQLVVSGSRDFLRENSKAFKEAGAKLVKELVVSGAFHSPLMEPAREELKKAIDSTGFGDAKVPVFANVSAKPTTNAAEIKDLLIAQLTSPVRWTQTQLNMSENGFDNFVEVGPGAVLQGLVKRTLKDVEFSGIDKLEDLRKYI